MMSVVELSALHRVDPERAERLQREQLMHQIAIYLNDDLTPRIDEPADRDQALLAALLALPAIP
jgi:hypothetical protein